MSFLNLKMLLPLRNSIEFSSCQLRQLPCLRSLGTSSVVYIKFRSTPAVYGIKKTNKKLYPSYFYKDHKANRRKLYYIGGAFALYVILATCSLIYSRFRSNSIDKNRKNKSAVFTAHQVAEHPNWTSYKGSVYDLSSYAAKHPGGEETIALAGGRALEPFFEEHDFHKRPDIMRELRALRIGALADEPDDTSRCSPPKQVPRVNPEDYRLELIVGDETIKLLKLEYVKSLPKHSIVSAIPCKSDGKQLESTSAPTWTGARLADILKELDVRKEEYGQLQFECIDTSKSGKSYGTRIPIEKAMDSNILLAYEMNGAEIPAEHGFPIRVVIPELDGNRNVKWLSKIVLVKNYEISPQA